MRTIRISEFKERCLSILDRLEPEGLIITKHGKPLARVLPFGRSDARLIGSLKGKIKIKGNILATGVKWNAESRYARAHLRSDRRSASEGKDPSRG